MKLTTELSDLLLEARTQLLAHPKYELILPTRKKIWRAMGPYLVGEKYRALHGVGLTRRTMLAVHATTRVLPIWEKHWPTADPHRMLELAQRYIGRQVDYDTVDNAVNSFSGGLENVGGIPSTILYSTYVGHAATGAAFTALNDEWMDDDETLDEDRDCWDTSFFACGAFSGEFPWAETSDPEKRLQFWEWYISEAVPKAYAEAT
jgi:hypothetical protein